MPQYAVMFTVDGDDTCLMLNAVTIELAENEAKVHIFGSYQHLDIYWHGDRPGSEYDVCWDEGAYMRYDDPCVTDVRIVEVIQNLSADDWQRELDSHVREQIDERNRLLELELARKNKTISTDKESLDQHGFVEWVKRAHPAIVKKFVKQVPKDPSIR